MKIIIFFIATIFTFIIATWPVWLFVITEDELVAYGGFIWFLIIGAANQPIQKSLESILK